MRTENRGFWTNNILVISHFELSPFKWYFGAIQILIYKYANLIKHLKDFNYKSLVSRYSFDDLFLKHIINTWSTVYKNIHGKNVFYIYEFWEIYLEESITRSAGKNVLFTTLTMSPTFICSHRCSVQIPFFKTSTFRWFTSRSALCLF